MNLHTKIGETEPGSHAHVLADLLYSYSITSPSGKHDKTKEMEIKLSKMQHYLESLAHAELRDQVKEEYYWIGELERKRLKVKG